MRCKEALLEHHPGIKEVHPTHCSACWLWGRGSEGRILFLHRCWWRLGTGTNQGGNLCRERALDNPVSLVIRDEACGQCQVLNERGAAGTGHPQSHLHQ